MRQNLILLIILSLFCFTSCDSYLDVKPTGQIDADDLLGTEKGFNIALNGVYLSLADKSLYGENLNVGVLDALAQTWQIEDPQNEYFHVSNMDFQHSKAKAKFNTIWSKMYFCIAQNNKLIEVLDNIQEIDGTKKELLRAELLSLRGFMHMELLKMFGDRITETTMNKKAIPYRFYFDNKAVSLSTTSEVLDYIFKDINTAKSLYDKHKIQDENIETGRMNRLSNKILLARYYNLINDKQSTYDICQEIINLVNDEYPDYNLTNEAKVLSIDDEYKDLKFSNEYLFKLYQNDQFEVYKSIIGYDEMESNNMGYLRLPSIGILDDLFNNEGEDFRYKFCLYEASSSFIPLKYRETLGQQAVISIMPITEVYYMAAESKIGVNNAAAINLIQEVRSHRGLSSIVLDSEDFDSDEQVITCLINDMQREYVGEGKMFYVYKRFGIQIDGLYKNVPVEDITWKFPLPDDEIEFGVQN